MTSFLTVDASWLKQYKDHLAKICSYEDLDADIEFVEMACNTEPKTDNGGQSATDRENKETPHSTQCSFDFLQPHNGTVYCDEFIEIRVNDEPDDNSNTAQVETNLTEIPGSTQCSLDYLQPHKGAVYDDEFIEMKVNDKPNNQSKTVKAVISLQDGVHVKKTELAEDTESGMAKSEVSMNPFICLPGGVDVCDVSTAVRLQRKDCANVINKLVYMNEKNGREGIMEEFCGQEFTRLNDASGGRHSDVSAITKHTNKKQFRCEHCGLACHTKCNLTKHKIIHTEGKAFKCDICGKGFTCRIYLTIHKRIHTGEKPYTCDICGFSYTSHSGLRHHQKIHTCEKYKCDNLWERFEH